MHKSCYYFLMNEYSLLENDLIFQEIFFGLQTFFLDCSFHDSLSNCRLNESGDNLIVIPVFRHLLLNKHFSRENHLIFLF